MSCYEYDRYDTDGKVLKSNNLGEEWMFDYRKDHTVVTDALGGTEAYGFDENQELVYRIDADGQRSDSERDDYGRITVERDPLGRETPLSLRYRRQRHRYHRAGRQQYPIDYYETSTCRVAVNDPAGRITAYDYDKRGNLISITDSAGYTKLRLQRPMAAETITDALGKTRRLHYDTLDQLVCFTDCTGETTRFGYTEYGDLETVTDALGHTTRHHYDAAGNPVRTDYPDGSPQKPFEYDRLNRLTAHIDGLGAKTAYELAVDGLPLKRTNALGHTLRLCLRQSPPADRPHQ